MIESVKEVSVGKSTTIDSSFGDFEGSEVTTKVNTQSTSQWLPSACDREVH